MYGGRGEREEKHGMQFLPELGVVYHRLYVYGQRERASYSGDRAGMRGEVCLLQSCYNSCKCLGTHSYTTISLSTFLVTR